jgi:ribosomal protein S18 acetylase RimI-like enzyme
MEEEVKRMGGRLILVETSGPPSYAPARKFYEACGYRLQATIPDFYAPGDDLLIYAKRL